MPRTTVEIRRFHPMPAIGHSAINGVLDYGVTVTAVADDLEIDAQGQPWYACECEVEWFRRYHRSVGQIGDVVVSDNGRFIGQVTATTEQGVEIDWQVI